MAPNSPPQTILTNLSGGTWHIALPKVYRYEDQIWIDEFFETGKLRLATFRKFSQYQDEHRGDSKEGIVFGAGIDSKNKRSIASYGAFGTNALILCCSTVLDPSLREAFNRNSQFQIDNTHGFAEEVARILSGFQFGIEGHCIYENDGPFYREMQIDIDVYEAADGTYNMERMLNDVSQQLFGYEAVLLKRKKYATQREYRLIWKVDKIADDYVDIECPRARQFCKKINIQSIP